MADILHLIDGTISANTIGVSMFLGRPLLDTNAQAAESIKQSWPITFDLIITSKIKLIIYNQQQSLHLFILYLRYKNVLLSEGLGHFEFKSSIYRDIYIPSPSVKATISLYTPIRNLCLPNCNTLQQISFIYIHNLKTTTNKYLNCTSIYNQHGKQVNIIKLTYYLKA